MDVKSFQDDMSSQDGPRTALRFCSSRCKVTVYYHQNFLLWRLSNVQSSCWRNNLFLTTPSNRTSRTVTPGHKPPGQLSRMMLLADCPRGLCGRVIVRGGELLSGSDYRAEDGFSNLMQVASGVYSETNDSMLVVRLKPSTVTVAQSSKINLHNSDVTIR